MAASGAKNVGSYGKIRVLVDLVLPQNIGANTSRVRVRGQMALRQGSNAHNNNGVHMKTTCSPGGSTTENNTFSVGTSWVTVIDNTYTVSHASDGNRTVTGTFELGSTGTSSFGSGGSVSLSLKLPRIPRPPSKPSRPTVSNVTSSAVTVNWSAPASNGAGIDKYQIRFYRETGTAWQDHEVTGRSRRYTGLDPNSVYRARVRAHNAAGWGEWSEYWTGSTKIAAPAAPTNVQSSRVNDGRVNLSWTRNHTSAAPVTSQRVQRRAFTVDSPSWGAWSNLATVSGTATSFTDTTTQPNTAYQWRVQAINSSGSAVSGGAKDTEIRMTAAAPTDVTAKKLASGDIAVSFKNASPYVPDVKYTIQDNPGGTGWVTVGTRTSDDQPFEHPDPNPAVSHQYRVRIEDTRYNLLTSAWSTPSNIVQLLAPPLAPSLVGPLGVVDRDEPVRLEYRHNPVDTTDQTAGEVRVYRDGSLVFPATSTGVDSFFELPAPGESSVYEWQARTRGEHAVWGPWSPFWTFEAVSRPEVVVQSPETTLEESQVEVVWGYQNADGSGQSRWEAQLLDAEGSVLATGSGSNTATSHLFPTVLEDATEYTVRVRARAGSGLWSEWDTSTFTTDFPLPYPVEVLPEWDRETGSVSITFQVDDSDATEQTPDSVDVQRDDDDGDGWITIATGLDPETSIVDHTPRLAVIRYRTISRTTLPTARTGPETVTEPPRGLWPVFLNGGPDLGDVIAIYDNTQLAFDRERAKTRHRWAGRDWPTTKWGQARSKTAALTATISPESPGATMPEIEALEDIPSVVCVRDILGHKIFVTIDSVSSDVERDGRWNVSIPMTREHYIEGVR